ncbi:hypothetical protein EPN96_06330 [bacterium]|nr:MAG: hypothetical protein EPN96_06330 [bacterium]
MKVWLTIASLITLGISLLAGFSGKTSVLAVGFLSFVVLLLIANIDRVSEFKATGTGVEAKTRDVLQRAEVTLSELQALAKHVGMVTLSLVKRSGRLGGYSDIEEEEIKNSILDVMKKVGIPNSECQEVLREWNKFIEYDYLFFILGGSTIPDGDIPEVHKEWKALRSGGIEKIPTSKEIKAFLEKHHFMTPDLEQWLLDYQCFIDKRIHRRPEVWQQRQSMGRLMQKKVA